MPTDRRDPKKTSEPAPSHPRPRVSDAVPSGAPRGEVRGALAVLHNVPRLLRQPSPRGTMESILSEIDSASSSLRAAFELAEPAALARFVDERLRDLDAAFERARESGDWCAALEPSSAIAADLGAACELLDLAQRARTGAQVTQTVDAATLDLAQRWHPLAAEGTLRLFVTSEAAEVELVADPRVATNLLGVIASLIEGDVVLSFERGALRFERGAGPRGRVVPRLRRVGPTLEVAQRVARSVVGELALEGDAAVLTLR